MESTVYRQSLSYGHNPTLVKKCWYDTRVRHTVNPQFSTWWKLHLLYCMECSHCFGRKSSHLLPLSLSSSFWQISKAVMCSEKWYFRIKFNDASHLNFGYVYTCRSGGKKKSDFRVGLHSIHTPQWKKCFGGHFKWHHALFVSFCGVFFFAE